MINPVISHDEIVYITDFAIKNPYISFSIILISVSVAFLIFYNTRGRD